MNILNNNIQLLCLMHVMAANIWACKLIHSEQHSNQAVVPGRTTLVQSAVITVMFMP